jgi:raffinose/stachyose/melibiose transport system substrate-binding protein
MRRQIVLSAMTAVGLALAAATPGLAQTTLRVMSWEPSHADGNAYWDELMDKFEAEHPGVEVEGNFVAFNQYLTTLAAMTAGESLPDVFFGHVKAAELGRAGLTVNFREALDPAFIDQFYPSPIRQFTFDGDALYGLPWTAQMFGIFVNDRLMSELGLSYPETWDELIDMAPAIREAGYTPLAFGNLAKNVCPDFFLPLITQYGGDVYALDDLTAEGVSWDSRPVIDALTLMQRLAEADVFLEGVNGVDERPAWQIAYQGRAVMLYSHSNAPNIFADEATQDWLDNYSVQKVPAVNAGDVHYSGDGSGRAWVVKANDENTELALDFVRFLYQPENYRTFIAAKGDFPAMPSALPEIKNEKVKTMAGWLATDGAHHILFGAGSWDAVSNVCQGILDGSIEPAAGAAQIQADVMATRAQMANQ